MLEPTVFIVDDDEASRASLKWLVESIGLKAKSFATTDGFLAAYDQDMPGCVVLDVRMPDMSGIQLQELLARRGVEIPIVFVTGFADVSTAVRALKKGAIDFIEKPYSNQQILDAIQESIRRDTRNREMAVERATVMSRVAQLTKRERQVLGMVIEGKSNKEIARELRLSPKTVENHRGKMMDKMQAKNLASLFRMALPPSEHDERVSTK